MRLVNDLVVRGEPAAIDRLVEQLKNYPGSAGWKREPEVEDGLRQWGIAQHGVYCFSRQKLADLPSVSLSLYKTAMDQLSSSSVISTSPRQSLTDEQHNYVLDDFLTQVLAPAREGLLVEVEVIPPRLSRLEWTLSPEALRRLNRFVTLNADRSALTPEDRSNWREFSFQVYSDGSMLDTQDLGTWLLEQGFSKDEVRDLIAMLDIARMHEHQGLGI